jgi:hypothetical protein
MVTLISDGQHRGLDQPLDFSQSDGHLREQHLAITHAHHGAIQVERAGPPATSPAQDWPDCCPSRRKAEET